MRTRLRRGFRFRVSRRFDLSLRFRKSCRFRRNGGFNLGGLSDGDVQVLAGGQFGGDGGLGRLAPLGVDTCSDRASLRRDRWRLRLGELVSGRGLSAWPHPLVAGGLR